MKNILQFASIITLLSAATMHAQTAPAPPLPAQLLSAKTIFLANAGSNTANNQEGSIAYNSMYQDLAAWNRYQLTSSPAEADLSFEVSVVSFSEGSTLSGNYVKLVVRDAKSQALIWTITENIEIANREKTFEKNIADCAAKIAADLGTLTSDKVVVPQPAVVAPCQPAIPAAKTRLQQEK